MTTPAGSEEEREQYYAERYESVLEELRHIRHDQKRMFNHFERLEKKVDETKAASETAHKEIIERLIRLEKSMN